MQTALIIGGAIIGIVAYMFFMARAKMKNMPNIADSKNILTLTTDNFGHQTKNKLVLVDFWAPWCGPCRMMAPVLNELSEEITGSAKIGKVNVDENQELAQKFKVRGIPTLILFNNGKEINRYVGVKQKSFLLNELNKVK